MKFSTFNFKPLLLFITAMLFNISFAQNASLSGTVLDESGAPIPGVNILIKESSKAVSTDFDGRYFFPNIKSGTLTITASYIGYKNASFTIIANQDTVKNITLLEDSNVLDDVIITGVVNPRTKIKSSVSVTSINNTQIEQSAPRSTAEIFRTMFVVCQFLLEVLNICKFKKMAYQYYYLEIFLLQQQIFLQDLMGMWLEWRQFVGDLHQRSHLTRLEE